MNSSIFYAVADRGDRGNERAKADPGRGERLVTSDHVLVETWFLLAHRLGRDAAEQYWAAMRGSAATAEPVGLADLVMQRLGVLRAATFDEHFAIFRFGRDRRRAFEIVR